MVRIAVGGAIDKPKVAEAIKRIGGERTGQDNVRH